MAKTKRKKKATPGEVVIEDGRRVARSVVMADDNGRPVERVAVVWPLDDMKRRGSIDLTQYAAGEAFRGDWHLVGSGDGIVSVDLLKCGGGGGWREPDPMFTGRAAEGRVRSIFASASEAVSSLLGTVVGDGMTVAWWVRKYTAETGQPMNNHKAAGLLVGALDMVAMFYGINRSKVGRKPLPPEQKGEARARRRLVALSAAVTVEREPGALRPVLSVGPVDLEEAERRAVERFSIEAAP